MPPRKPSKNVLYEFNEGVLQALSAIVQRMEEGESLTDAVGDDHTRSAHSEMSYARYVGFVSTLDALEQHIEYAYDQKTFMETANEDSG